MIKKKKYELGSNNYFFMTNPVEYIIIFGAMIVLIIASTITVNYCYQYF